MGVPLSHPSVTSETEGVLVKGVVHPVSSGAGINVVRGPSIAARISDPIDPAYIVNGAAAYLTHIQLHTSGVMRFRTDADASQFGTGAGPQLTEAAKNSIYLILFYGDNSAVWDFSKLVDSDLTEPFDFSAASVSAAGPANDAALRAAIEADTSVIVLLVDGSHPKIDIARLATATQESPESQPASSNLDLLSSAPPAPAGDVMWIDVVTDGVRYGPLRDILAWQQDEIWNEGSRFAFTAIDRNEATRIEALSEIFAYGIVGGHVTVIGAGIVQEVKEHPEQTQRTLAVTGVGFEHELLGRAAVDLEFSDASHETVVGALAVGLPSGWSLHHDPEIAHARLGLRLSAVSMMAAVRKCAEIFNTRLQFGFSRTIQMGNDYAPLTIVASNDPGLGAHIVDLNKVTSAKEITTVLTPYAADRRPRLADATDAAPKGFLLDAVAGTLTHIGALQRYGNWHKEHTFRALIPNDDTLGRAGIANILLSLAVERLRQFGEPQESYTIVVQGMRQMIRPFHQLAVKVRHPVIDDSFRVASVSTTFDQEAGLQQTVTVTTRQSVQHADDLSLLARRLQDLFDATTFAASADRQVYTGAARTSFTKNGGGGAAPVLFAANVGDDVRARFEIGTAQSEGYEYAVDNGPGKSLNVTAELDLSADIQTNGTHSLTVYLSAVPLEPVQLLVRITVS